MEITGEALSMARIGLNIERDELAKLLGVSLRTVANWEKNGVPQHRIALVMTKMGGHIRAAQDSIEYQTWLKSPDGAKRQEEDDQRLLQSGVLDEPMRELKILPRQAHSNDLLSLFSTETLLDEVSRRVAHLEANQRDDALDLLASQKFDAAPGYSDTSEQDTKVDKHIDHDEWPTKP